MKKRLRALMRREEGNYVLLFAATMICLIFFVGIGVDLSLAYMRRNALENLCQVAREDRFTYQDTIRYADNPAVASYQVIQDTLRMNGFGGTLTVYFKEEEPLSNHREYRIRTQLSEEFEFHFLRIFGASSATISVALDGGETYGESGLDVVWHPAAAPASYNGSYTGSASGGYTFASGDLPSGW